MSSDTWNEDLDIDWTGVVLSKKFIAISKIGHGSFGSVWKSFDITKKNLVAIKIHNTSDEKYGIKEYDFYKKLILLKIPNVLQVLCSFKEKDANGKNHFCIVLNLMWGSLLDLISKYDVSLPVQTVISIGEQINLALAHLHNNNIVHCDVKPDNILISGISGENNRLLKKLQSQKTLDAQCNYIKSIKKKSKVCDFASDISTESSKSHLISIDNNDTDNCEVLSKFPSDELALGNLKVCLSDFGSCHTASNLKFIYYTQYYTSPEALMHLKCSAKIDLWALGCTLYEIYTKKILFPVDDVTYMKNRYHVYMINMIDEIKSEMKNSSSVRDVYFCMNGDIKGFPLNTEVDTCIVQTITDLPLLKFLLKSDPTERCFIMS